MPFSDPTCMACQQPITELDGVVLCDRFVGRIRAMVEQAGSAEAAVEGAHGPIINAVTQQYFEAFHDVLSPLPKDELGTVNLADGIESMLIDAQAPVYRLGKVLEHEDDLKPDVYLVLHNGCVPQEWTAYTMELARIDREDKAIEWTIHHSERVSWNPRAWGDLLAYLFGRIGC